MGCGDNKDFGARVSVLCSCVVHGSRCIQSQASLHRLPPSCGRSGMQYIVLLCELTL